MKEIQKTEGLKDDTHKHDEAIKTVERMVAFYIVNNRTMSIGERAADQEWLAAWRASIASIAEEAGADYRLLSLDKMKETDKVTEARLLAKATPEYRRWRKLEALVDSIDKMIDSMKHRNNMDVRELNQ